MRWRRGRRRRPAPAAAGRTGRRSRRPRPARRPPGRRRAGGQQLAAPRRRASRSSVERVRAVGATRPVSWLRLVTTTRQPGEPGSSGRTCSASRALSSTISIRRPASWLRYSAACASRSAGIRRRRHAERVEEPAHRLGRVHDRAVRVEAAQVHVQLAVREPVGDPVRPVHGQGRLADARRCRRSPRPPPRCPRSVESASSSASSAVAAGESERRRPAAAGEPAADGRFLARRAGRATLVPAGSPPPAPAPPRPGRCPGRRPGSGAAGG